MLFIVYNQLWCICQLCFFSGSQVLSGVKNITSFIIHGFFKAVNLSAKLNLVIFHYSRTVQSHFVIVGRLVTAGPPIAGPLLLCRTHGCETGLIFVYVIVLRSASRPILVSYQLLYGDTILVIAV